MSASRQPERAAARAPRRTFALVFALSIVPLVLYFALRARLAALGGGAGVMLGAVSGNDRWSIGLVLATLGLRVYTVVLLPSVVAYHLVAVAAGSFPRERAALLGRLVRRRTER